MISLHFIHCADDIMVATNGTMSEHQILANRGTDSSFVFEESL